MKKSLIPTIFWALVGTFIVIMGEFFIPAVRELFRGSLLFLLPFIVFSLLGLALILLTVREKARGMLRKFLILTGACAAGFFISVFLHNVIYGLFITLFGPDFWNRIGLGDEPFFFFLAIFVCPIGFLVGVVGSIAMFVKERKGRQE